MTEQTTTATTARPTSRTRELTTAALLAALMAGTSWIAVPFGAVPVTLQTIFVLLAALMLTPGWAATAMLLYLALGAVGLPVFSAGQSGLGTLLGPTGGFLIAFPIAAAAGSAIYRAIAGKERTGDGSLIGSVVAVIGAELVIYLIGVPWLVRSVGLDMSKALAAAVAPFLVPDLLKAAIAVVVAQAVMRARR